MKNPATVDPAPGNTVTVTAVNPAGAGPLPMMLVAVLPLPLFVSSPISSTPAGTVMGNVSPLLIASYWPGSTWTVEPLVVATVSACVMVLNGEACVPGFASDPTPAFT